MTRTLMAAVFCCALSTASFAEQTPFYDCQTIRAFVAEHGKVKALAIALERGATFAQIREAARKCLSKR